MPNGGTYEQAKQAEEMMLEELPWLWPVGILTFAAIVAVILAMLVPRHRQGFVGAWVAAAHLAAAALAVVVWRDRGFMEVMEGIVVVDGLSLTLTAVIGVAGALCVALARPSVAGTDREGEFYAVLTFASLSAVLLGMAADAALLGLSIGALGLATFVMTGYARRSPASNEASIKYYIFGTVSGGAMLYGLSWWFGMAGTTNLQMIGDALAEAPTGVVVASTALVLFGLGYKAALVPFHFWTPDAYEGAPLPVAAYLSVLPKLAGLVALARVLPLALPDDTAGWTTAVAILAAATMTLGNVAALPQRNVVRLLAYSSIAQSGYLLMGVAALEASDDGLPALVYYAIAYAAMNLAAFAVVLAVQRERHSVDLDAFRGLGRRHPWWTAALIISFLSLLGLPPLAGFVGKLELFRAAIDADQAWLAAIAVVNTVVSLYYYLRVIAAAVLDAPPERPAAESPRSFPPPVAATLALTAIATVTFGVAAEPLLRLRRAGLDARLKAPGTRWAVNAHRLDCADQLGDDHLAGDALRDPRPSPAGDGPIPVGGPSRRGVGRRLHRRRLPGIGDHPPQWRVRHRVRRVALPPGVESFATNAGNRSSGGEKGTSVMAILLPPDYRPLVYIMAGDLPGTPDSVEQIDLAAPAPAWSPVASLNQPRAQQCTATLLPTHAPRALLPGVLRPRPAHDHKRAGGHQLRRHVPGRHPDATGHRRSRAPASRRRHARLNQSQRGLELVISATGAGTIDVESPPDANLAPPGWYRLFLLNSSRVPSIGRWVRVTP